MSKKHKNPMDLITENLKKSAWTAVIESVVLLGFGILLVAWPGLTYYIASVVLGVILIVAGIYQIVNYFIVKGQNDFFDNSLLFGVISIILGIVSACFVHQTFNVFRIVIGVWLIFEALIRINSSIKLRAANVTSWSWVLVIALFMLAAGLFTLFNTTLVIQVVGGLMIAAGVCGIISDLIFAGQVDAVAKKMKE